MNLLNQRCNIERATVSKNAQKQTVKTWNLVKSNAKCNIQFDRISTNNFQQTVSGQTTAGQYIGFFDKDENVKNGDKITWNNINLFVKGIPFPVFASGNTVHHLEAFLSVEES